MKAYVLTEFIFVQDYPDSTYKRTPIGVTLNKETAVNWQMKNPVYRSMDTVEFLDEPNVITNIREWPPKEKAERRYQWPDER